jgi:F-type H+-transporting ATPase subunit delta
MSESNRKIPTVFDSEEQHVGEVYAKALLGAAAKEKNVDTIVDQLESLVHDVLDRNPQLDLVIANPKMPFEAKASMLDRVFGSQMHPTLLTFLKVLARRGRLSSLRDIQTAASKLRDEAAGRIQVAVTVSKPLTAEDEASLVAKLKNAFHKEVRLQTKVDPKILGGLVIRVGDTVYDGSVDGQLTMLRKSVAQRAEGALRSATQALVTAS